MRPRRRSKHRSSAGRSYMADALKAAAHPTRQDILKALEEKPHTTVELEEVTGENRYQ